ncbi:MAG: transporter substrate-binding domain-containing protein [Clostridiales bacterium]
MKRIIFLVSSVFILLYLFGCSTETTNETATIEKKENNNKKTESASTEVATEQEVKVISCFKGSNSVDASFEVLKEAYKRIGIKLEREFFPGQRALEKSNAGETDGETMRIKGLEKDYPNLVIVDEPVYEVDFFAIVKDKKFEVNGPESLRPYNLGYVRGILFIENMIKGMNFEAVPDGNSLVKKIDAGRTDVGIMSREDSLKVLKDTGLDLTILEPPIQTLSLYHYLNKDNAYLVEKVTTKLKEMKSDGTWEKIIKKYE